MEQIVFPVPNICEYLTEESKGRVFHTTERDDQGSKVNDFFQQFDNLYNEMRWQKKIRSESPPPMLRQQRRRDVHSLAHSLAGLSRPCRLCAENKALFWFSRHISLWGSISFYLACLVNIAVAVFYPFGDDGDEGKTYNYVHLTLLALASRSLP